MSVVNIDIAKNKDRFFKICDLTIKRENFNKLLDWLETTDFFVAPASTKFHNSVPGGLLDHSLNVYDMLVRIRSAYPEIQNITSENIAISALMHDLCKVDTYKKEIGRVKEDGMWKDVIKYVRNEKFVYGGHGSKSVYLCQKFICLTDEEAIAINCHMGSSDGTKDAMEAFAKHPLAWMLHVADEAATYLLE